jgi:nucleoside-diphosphate-sugar epimerase
MRILVTGAGLVGSWVARHLLAMGHAVAVFDVAPPAPWAYDVIGPREAVTVHQGDITDLPDIMRALQAARCDAIVHTAALLTAAVRQRAYAGIRINVVGSVNVLEAARLAGGIRVVFCSSSTAYASIWGDYTHEPIPADFRMRVLSDRPRSVYATTKLAVEWLGLNYVDEGYGDFVALRFQGVVGPWGGTLSGIPGRVLKTIVEPAVRGEDVVISDPLITWDGVEEFVHASDAGHGAALAAVAAAVAGRVYSIGMGRAYTLQDVLDAAHRVFPARRFTTSVQPSGGIAGYPVTRRRECDPEPARRELGYAPAFDMEASIRDYAAWYRAHSGRVESSETGGDA